MAMIKERELQTTLDKARYYTNESKQQSSNIEFYFDDLSNLYKTKNSYKIANVITELKNMNKKLLTNDESYCTVIDRTIASYKKDAALSKQNFENITTGGK